MFDRVSLRREIRFEAELTRPFLQRLDGLDLSWSPSPSSWSFGQLAAHIAVLPYWGLAILRLERHDMAAAKGWKPPATIDLVTISRDFETNIASLLEEVQTADLESIWIFVRGSEVIAELPKASAIRHYVLGHIAHHRGQLALYLRLAGSRVPGGYGSSRDEAPRVR